MHLASMRRNVDRDRDDNAMSDVANGCLDRVARKLFFAGEWRRDVEIGTEDMSTGLLGLSGGTYAAIVYSK